MGLTNLRTKEMPPLPQLDLERARSVIAKIDAS